MCRVIKKRGSQGGNQALFLTSNHWKDIYTKSTLRTEFCKDPAKKYVKNKSKFVIPRMK